MIFTTIAYLLLTLAPAVLGCLMLYNIAADDFPTPQDTISFICVAVVCFGLSAFFLWQYIRRLRRHRNGFRGEKKPSAKKHDASGSKDSDEK